MTPLTRAALRWMDGLWDPSANLLWYEQSHAVRADGKRRHMVRESAWYALGLCMRNGTGDVMRADAVVSAVLAQQYRAPGAIWHGTWARAPEDPQPGAGAVIWRDYDPNWRQFIGATLLIIQRVFPAALAPDNLAGITRAVRDAVLGEPADRVDARYTNIAMLRAWLDVEAGGALAQNTWIARGVALADAVVERYRRFGALDEFNSPTYYGVDLLAAALWARRSERLAAQGARIEAMLWRDVADFYHAGMGNLCGPYSRAYGMDLHAYVGLVSLWLRQVDSAAPLPAVTDDLEHGHDLCLAPFVELLGTQVPEVLLCNGAMTHFDGERFHTRRLPSGALATAWLGRHLMIGGLSGSRAAARDQCHPATAHWCAGNAQDRNRPVHWLRLRSAGPLHATTAPGVLAVAAAAAQEIAMEVSDGAVLSLPGSGTLLLPGMRIDIESSVTETTGISRLLRFQPTSQGADGDKAVRRTGRR